MKRTVMTMWVCVVGMVLGAGEIGWTAPLGTAFTYQGRLTDGGSPAEGNYAFVFKVYDSLSGVTPVGTDSFTSVAVSEGYFTVSLDFGTNVFEGEARWLEIWVRKAGIIEAYTVLSPRQEITPAPYALYAVSSGADSDWVITGNNMFSNVSGNVGIGTSTPSEKLEVAGTAKVETAANPYGIKVVNQGGFSGISYGIHAQATSTDNRDYNGIYGSATGGTGSNTGVYGYAAGSGYKNGVIANATGTGTNYALYATASGGTTNWAGYFNGNVYAGGNVGIGTNSPGKTLDVIDGDNTSLRVGQTASTSLEVVHFNSALADVPGSTFGMQVIGPANSHVVLDVGGNDNDDGFYVRVPTTIQMNPTVDKTAFVVKATGNVGIGTSAPSNSLSVTGIADFSGAVAIGTTTPQAPLDVRGRVLITQNGESAGDLKTLGANGGLNTVMSNVTGYPNRGGIGVLGDDGAVIQAIMYVDSNGDGIVEADTKNFRIPNANQPGTDIVYACIEGPEAAAYVRGTAHLKQGKAVITIPDHFRVAASESGMTVQLTPLSADSLGLGVIEKNLQRIVVKELQNGAGDYEFDYLVMAVRAGHENYQVIRPSKESKLALPGKK